VIRLYLVFAACLALLGCAAGNPPPATSAEVARAAWTDGSPPEITLITVLKAENDGGAHTALLVNGSQRVLWDPAGSFRHPNVPEVGDVLYGITPLIDRVYTDYHVRPDFYIVRQSLPVSAETAERLITAMKGQGNAGQATCALTTSGIMRAAGIEVGRTWFPNALMDDFGQLPGVTTQRIDTSNVNTNHNVIFGKGGVPLPRGA